MRNSSMRNDQKINEIIERHAPALIDGQESLESILDKYPEYSAELRPELEAILWLHQARLALATRPGFISDSRKYLEAKITSSPPLNYWQRLFRRYSPQHLAFYMTAPALIIVLLAMIINGVVLTARMSIPGDPFYSTKLTLESVQMALTIDPVGKSELYLQFSKERTTELVELVLDSDYEALPAATLRLESEISATLRSLSYLRNHNMAISQAETDQLKANLYNQIIMLDILKENSPSTVSTGIDAAIRVAQTGLMALR
jgi:hypothetical protein